MTRARAQAAAFSLQLVEAGAAVIEFPTIRVEPPQDLEPLRRAIQEVREYDWVVFTSANGVTAFWRELRGQGLDAQALCGVRVCAIGPATAATLERMGVVADLVPVRYIAEAVVEALAGADMLTDRRILLPRAAVAREELPAGLGALGARVVEVAAYRTVPDGEGMEALRARLDRREVDLVTFTSSSTVINYHRLLGTFTGGAPVAAIGPVTARTARDLGFAVAAVAEEFTTAGLVQACIEFFRRSGTREG